MNKLRDWYTGLQQREQRMVAMGGVAVAVLILLSGILSVQSAVSSARERNEIKRTDLAWMQTHQQEIRDHGNQIAPDTGEAPVVTVDRVAREDGLTSALRGTQPNGTGVRVQLEGASFDTLIVWLATLDERHGLAVETINVERTARPGEANATVTFVQSRH